MPAPAHMRDSARRSRLWWTVAFVCWVAFIWGHWLVQGPASSAESGLVVSLVRPVFEALGVTDADLMSHIVRKCAHFSEYAVLGFLGYNLFGRLRALGEGKSLWGALIVALVPVLDETIQLFVPGRSSSPVDVCIDLSGAVTGALLTALLLAWHRRRAARRA